MAAICRQVPAQPAHSFREALQSFWFTYLLGHMEGSHLGYSPDDSTNSSTPTSPRTRQ